MRNLFCTRNKKIETRRKISQSATICRIFLGGKLARALAKLELEHTRTPHCYRVGSEDERRRAADAVAYDVECRLHRAWLLRQDSCPLGDLWNYYGDAGRGDTQEEMDAYNEFNTFGVDMDNPVAPWFAKGDDENGGPDASTYFIG